MSAISTTEERLQRVDHEIDALKDAFVDAIQELQRTSEIDGSFGERWEQIRARLDAIQSGVHAPDFDKDQVVELYQSLLAIKDLVMAGTPSDLDTYDALLVNIERIRHVVRDALDEHVAGVQSDVGAVMQDLEQWLPHTPDRVLAELLQVDRRTLSRWKKQSGAPRRRLRVVAAVVAILRHNWTEDGIVAWFYRPRRDLGERAPLALLDDPSSEPELIAAARAGRSQYAS